MVLTTELAQRPKEQRVYRANMKNWWLLSGIALPFVCLLTRSGLKGLQAFPPEAQDPFRYLAGYLPLVLAAASVIGLGILFLSNQNRRIGVSPTHFLYSQGKTEPLALRWEDVIFKGPRLDQKELFPTAMVSDGTSFVRFEKFFFPEFQEICDIVTAARRAASRKDLVI